MADIQYDVLANLTMKGGAFSGDMAKAATDADKLGASWGKLISGGSQLMGSLGGLVATAGKIGGVAAGVMAGAAGMGVGVIGTSLSELEGKSIQLASVLAAATKTPFETMQQQSKALFDEFRKDAVESAGETADFVDIASKIGGPIMGAGKSMADLHRITKGVVEMAPSLGIDFKQAGSDVMRMLQGTAGMESPLFAAMVAIPSLGIKKAEEFNKLSPEKRIAKLEEALTNPAFRNAAAAYGNSWHGLTSTFSDVTKSAGMMVGEPLYALAKKGLAAFNDAAIKAVQGGAGRRLATFGQALASDFVALANVLKPIFPSFEGSALSAIGVIESMSRGAMDYLIQGTRFVVVHWGDIKSGAQAAYHWIDASAERMMDLVTALGGGDFEKGLKRAGELAIALKAAQIGAPALTMASGAAGLAGGAAKGLVGLFGGGGAAAAATTATATGGAAAAGGGAAAATAGVSAGAAMATVGAVLAGIAVLGAAAWKTFESFPVLGQTLREAWDSVGYRWKAFKGQGEELSVAMGRLYNAAKPLYEAGLVPMAAIIGGPLTLVIIGATTVLDGLVSVMTALAMMGTDAANAMAALITTMKDKLGIKDPPALGPTEDTADVNKRELPVGGFSPMLGVAAGVHGGPIDPKKKAPDKAATKVVVELKWELGEGNEDAIFIKTRKDILDMFRGATGTQRTSRLAGT